MKLKIIFTVLMCLMLCACSQEPAQAPDPVVLTPNQPEVSFVPISPKPIWNGADMEISKDEPLMCIAESQEEAEEIAGLYGITLVRYENKVARFFTEENLDAVIQRGRENGWVQLSYNRIANID